MIDLISIPPVIGHRGAAGLAPENTLASIRRARAEGAAWVEFDVMLSADDAPVLFHDETLRRTTDARGRVAKTPLAALRGCDAGSWFDPSFAGERIPTLAEAIDCLAAEGLGANVEIKPSKGKDVRTATVVCEQIQEIWPETLPGPVISSFSLPAMQIARDLCPDVQRAALFERLPGDWRDVAADLSVNALHLSARHITPAVTDAVTSAGFVLRAYTVNDPARARALWNMGVSSVFTDRPDVVRA